MKIPRLAAFALVLGSSSTAFAWYPYPGEIVSHLSLACDGGMTPFDDGCQPAGCTLCHGSCGGGAGTVTHPFGMALYAEGLRDNGAGSDLETLDHLLDQAADAGSDFNCDGVPDIEQLRSCDGVALVTLGSACSDAGVTEPLPPATTYGCSVGDAEHTAFAAGLVPVGIALLLLGRRRVRRSAIEL